jgi:hypothetical protein
MNRLLTFDILLLYIAVIIIVSCIWYGCRRKLELFSQPSDSLSNMIVYLAGADCDKDCKSIEEQFLKLEEEYQPRYPITFHSTRFDDISIASVIDGITEFPCIVALTNGSIVAHLSATEMISDENMFAFFVRFDNILNDALEYL